MAYNKYEVLGIEHDTSTDGKPRVRLVCRETEPRVLKLNLTRADSSRVKQFEDLIGQTAMLPCRTGQTDQGLGFLVLEDGEPFAIPSSVVPKSLATEQKTAPDFSKKFGA
jgi:hypothetical protein